MLLMEQANLNQDIINLGESVRPSSPSVPLLGGSLGEPTPLWDESLHLQQSWKRQRPTMGWGTRIPNTATPPHTLQHTISFHMLVLQPSTIEEMTPERHNS